MKHFACIILLLAACAEAEDIDMGDGAVPSDGSTQDAHVDADEDADLPDAAESDAHIDAGAPDADDPLPWPYFREGDECDLVAQNCPFAGHTCRREHLGEGEFGSAKCVEYGTLLTANPTPCNQTNLCTKGLFCLNARCLRPCDPDGDACPNTDHGNSPQTCVEASDYPQPYCEWWNI